MEKRQYNGEKGIQWSKGSLFNKYCWNKVYICKKINLGTDVIPFTKINSKLIIDFIVKCKIIKLLENKRGENQLFLSL